LSSCNCWFAGALETENNQNERCKEDDKQRGKKTTTVKFSSKKALRKSIALLPEYGAGCGSRRVALWVDENTARWEKYVQ
jgi:hypothetical protein